MNRKVINGLTAASLIAATGVVIWGVACAGQLSMQSAEIAPIQAGPTSAIKPPESKNEEAQIGPELSTSDAWQRSLQSGFREKRSIPKTEPKPVLPPAPSPSMTTFVAPPDLGLRLVGTVIEKGRSMAIAVDRQGKLDFCFEGALLQLEPQGICVDEVSSESVKVSLYGKSATWQMGQSLRFEGVASDGNAMPAAQSPNILEPNEPKPAKPKMSIEEELELINGGATQVPH